MSWIHQYNRSRRKRQESENQLMIQMQLLLNDDSSTVTAIGGTSIESDIDSPTSGVIYTNLDQYIINDVRQATTGVTIRSNVSSARRFTVTETSTFNFMTFIRIPPENWTSSGLQLRPTLSVISGSGGTIDGGTSSKQFFGAEEVILNPPTDRVNVDNLEHYDTYKMKPVDESSTVLTPGEYLITLITGPFNANTKMATLTMAQFPIDTNQNIYFSATQPFSATNYFAMQLEI